jgi:hypothetical protein
MMRNFNNKLRFDNLETLLFSFAARETACS